MPLHYEFDAMTALGNSSDITVERHALEMTQYFAQDATTLILQFSLSSLLFGILTILALTSVSLLLIPLLSTIILYASTTIYMAGLVWNWSSVSHVVAAVNEGILLGDGYDGRADLLILEKDVLKQSLMVTVALGINIIVGDAVVWWRACVIWQNRAVYYTGPALLTLTLVFGIIGVWKSEIGPLTSIYLMYGGSGYTDVAAALSLVTNLAATALIAFKACLHRRRLKKYLDTSGTKTRVLKVLALFIESGIVYCAILLAVLVYQFNYESTSTLVDAGFYFTYGCLVPTVAIYPTVIIVLTAVNCSPLDWGLSPLGELVNTSSPIARHRRAPLTLSIIRFRPPTILCSTPVLDSDERRDLDSPGWTMPACYNDLLQSPQTARTPQTPPRESRMFEPELGMREDSESAGIRPHAPSRRDADSIAVAV
ncbi:hypothetical protein GSI_09590 [Ganoderma sinense ZZ0214-1]|uniref:Uncharacterized protein n=1 Tax=Ganoderma sinense ZZ0214-1 TaxID=1077348 RepID=A0A2G8S3G5_9APHY|nr:hypothetical protein GSI_09590 [Ganoderma sinense ZZ0214-1]